MTSAAKWFLAGLVLGGLVVGGMVLVLGNRQYAKLQAYADSVGVADSTKAAQVKKYSDSITALVSIVSVQRTKIIVRTKVDTTQVAAVLARAKSASDSAAQVPVLLAANRNLFQALTLSDSIIRAETRRGDSLQTVTESLNQGMQRLVGRINSLHGTPTWLKVSFEVLKIGGAGYVGWRVGRGR
jgi:hypothetical protein